MGRKKIAEGGTREKIVEAAKKIFIEKGYEQASVRMILEESSTVTGSFYHYFESKEELFEAVVADFLHGYENRVLEITRSDKLTILQKIQAILSNTEQSTRLYYQELQAEKLHWTIQYALHKRTIQAILPGVQEMLEREIENGTIENPLKADSLTLAAVILQGIEGILHVRSLERVDEAQLNVLKEKVIVYVNLVLGLKPEPMLSV